MKPVYTSTRATGTFHDTSPITRARPTSHLAYLCEPGTLVIRTGGVNEMRRRTTDLSFIAEIARVLTAVTRQQLHALNRTLRPLPTDATPLVTLTRDASAAFLLWRTYTMPLLCTRDEAGEKCSFSNPEFFGAIVGQLWADHLMRTARALDPDCLVVVMYRGFVLAIPPVVQVGDCCFDLRAYEHANNTHVPAWTHEAPKLVM